MFRNDCDGELIYLCARITEVANVEKQRKPWRRITAAGNVRRNFGFSSKFSLR